MSAALLRNDHGNAAPKRRFLRAAQSVAAAAGISAAVAGAWFLFGGVLGSFIS